MGIKTEISYKDINSFFNVKTLTPTSNGFSHTVYILNDEYILKLYEGIDEACVDSELKLLKLCNKLCVAKVVKDLHINKKRAVLFEKAKGGLLKKASNIHLKQIALFLKDFHKITKDKSFEKRSKYSKSSLKNLILKTKNKSFLKEFESIEITLNNDGIIHGDLFLDNATFLDDKLTCVFDFTDACEGDFLFDLAVVALSWCDNLSQVKFLIDIYDKNISFNTFIKYLRYASLYYCVTRFLDNRDYDNILFENKFV